VQTGGVLLDRYEVVRPLGRGGAGELVLVKDRKAGQEPCALKILKPRIPDPGLAPLFKNEFLLLAGVRHPSIVGVRDFGTLSSGEPYFTMDFVPGEDCRAFVQHDRLEAHEYIDLAAGLLSALSHSHAQGIVHRDIKPENVIMRRGDGRLHPVLIDFGLAMTSAATRSGEAGGTLPYVAPEVLAGAGAQPRSDLFSLGMLLYEVATGKSPGEPREILSTPHRVFAPDRIRRLLKQSARGAVPRRFGDLISRLLAPTPAGRFASAGTALTFLKGLYGDKAVEALADVQVELTIGEAPLVGRASALDALMKRVEGLSSGRLLDPIVVVAGADGSGVTRLLATLRNHAAASRCLVCTGASLEELAADLLSHPQVEAEMAPVDEGPKELIFRVDAALHGLPRTEHPVMIVDDVHLLSDAAAQALRGWVSALEQRDRARCLLVLGGRVEGDSPGAELLRTAGRAVPVELRDLAPLTTVDIRNALATVLGRDRIPAPVVQALERSSGGNPRLFAAILRLLVDEGVLGFEDDEPILHEDKLRRLRLPKGVFEVYQRRTRRLDKKRRDTLARFALVGDPLSFASAESVAGGAFDRLLAEGFLVRDRGRIRFPNEAARRAADVWDGDVRKKGLRQTAAALAELEPAVASVLWTQAGDWDKAHEVGIPAARTFMEARRHHDAQRLLTVLAGPLPCGEAGVLLARVRYLVGRVDEAARLGVRLLDDTDDRELLMTTCSALREAGRPSEALELLRRFDRETQGDAAARIANAKAAMLQVMGRHEEALLESGRAEAAAGSVLGLDGGIARIRANVHRWAGRRTSALRVEETLIAAEPGTVRADYLWAAVANRGQYHHRNGHLVLALRDLRRALRLGRELGREKAEGDMWVALAEVFLDLGRPLRALTCQDKALALFEKTAHGDSVGFALLGAAHALILCGRPVEAEARLLRARGLPGTDHLSLFDQSLSPARMLLAYLSGRAEEALTECGEALDRVGSNAREGAAALAVLAAEITEATLQPEDAEEAWRRALRHAWLDRRRDALAHVRIGLAGCALQRGAWHLADATLDRCDSQLLELKTPLRARALLVRATSALNRGEPAAAGRYVQEAVAVANRTGVVLVLAETYSAVASLLEEPRMQRHLRQPTGAASATLLETARDAWTLYGNEEMLRKIDLHLSELPRVAADPLAGPDAERLVKVLHIAREMNREFDRDRLLRLILDRAIELTGAERGFVILLREGREEVHLARNIDREAVSEPEHKISSQIIGDVIRTGRIVRSEDAQLDERFADSLSVRQLHLKSIIAVPFRSGGKTVGALYLDNRFRTGNFTDREERLLELFADQAVAAVDKAEMIHELEGQRQELEDLYKQQKSEFSKQGSELRHAKREIRQHRRDRGWGFDRIVARSVPMQAVIREAKRFATSELPVLLTGDNGTGKEMVAKAVHYASGRQSMPFVAVNCAAFPEGLLEAELFGHVRGSFTGADRDRAGLFEEADGGTLFLDEVGDMAPPMQVRLLRTLENGELRRVGEAQTRTVDVRILAATNADLEELIRNGKFREDLYYRLSGFVMRIPPLRERLEDIEPLAYAFVEEAARREGHPELTISNEAIARLESFTWSGNVRELRNVILRAVVTAEGDTIGPDDIAFDARSPAVLPGFDPGHADRVLDELASRGVELNRRQQTGITRVLTRGKLSFGEYRQLFRVSKSTTARDLEQLVSHGLLDKRGRTRAVIYLPGAKLRDAATRSGRL